MTALRIADRLWRKDPSAVRNIQQRLAVLVLGEHVLTLDQKAVTGIRRQQIQALLIRHQYRIKPGPRRRTEATGKRLALATGGRQGVSRQ